MSEEGRSPSLQRKKGNPASPPGTGLEILKPKNWGHCLPDFILIYSPIFGVSAPLSGFISLAISTSSGMERKRMVGSSANLPTRYPIEKGPPLQKKKKVQNHQQIESKVSRSLPDWVALNEQ